MSLCRIVYLADGQIRVIHPDPNARKTGESDIGFLNRVSQKAVKGTELEGLPYEDVDTATLPPRKSLLGVPVRDKWRKKKVGKGIEIDAAVVTEAEKRQAIEDALDAELAKPSPNAVKAIKLQRQLQKKQYG